MSILSITKKKHETPEEPKSKQRRLFFDKRVRHILKCDSCSAPITLAEAKRNHGLCDDCTKNHSYLE